MGGVERHDRLVGHHFIHLSSNRAHIKIFFQLQDSALVNSWILFKTAMKTKGEWNLAEERRYSLAWLKESVIRSICGTYRSRKQAANVKFAIPPLLFQSVKNAIKHQISPVSHIPGTSST